MAYCNLWMERGSNQKAINYAIDENKTAKDLSNVLEGEQTLYVDGINVDLSRPIAPQFREVQNNWGLKSGVLCVKGVQSFSEGELDADAAQEIGIELVQSLWGNDFQGVVTTHRNTNCLHNHFVVNATSFVDGHHLPSKTELLPQVRSCSNELCERWGVGSYGGRRKHSKSRAEYDAEKAGEPTLRHGVSARVISCGSNNCQLVIYLHVFYRKGSICLSRLFHIG